MKVSVSIPDDDVAFLDAYATEPGVGSRSAAIQHAVAMLRASRLESAYELALADWKGDPAAAWERTPPPRRSS
jgi:Arc/MetJ-type ribon-helix-helix transcriptional regulator